ncbi:hypothetical protein OAV62_02310 [bacterium]|nr:hypothetical protein [bacterium]
MIYSTFSYPCIDKYPQHKEFITNEQTLRMAQRRLKSGKLQSNINTEFKKLKAAFIVNTIWKPDAYPILKIAFMDGSEKQKSWVKKIIGEHLEPHMSKIKFEWNSPPNQSHIRISFKLPGQAWSMIGNEANMIPKSEPTMNLGWLDDDTQFNNEMLKNTGMVVLHEFGHAIGMIHEHQNPKDNPIKWNHPVVYAELKKTNGWDQQMVDNNMFKKYGDYELCQTAKQEEDIIRRKLDTENYCQGQLINGSTYDVTSVMHYFYPQTWIKEGPGKIPVNLEYSTLDKKWIRKFYGDPEKFIKTVSVETDAGTEDVQIEETENDELVDVDIDLEIAIDKKEESDNAYLWFLIKSILAMIIFLMILYVAYTLIQAKSTKKPFRPVAKWRSRRNPYNPRTSASTG